VGKDSGRTSTLVLALIAILLVLIAAGWLIVNARDKTAPSVTVTADPAAIGRKTMLSIEVSEPAYGIRSVRAVLVQGGREYPIAERSTPARPLWQLWGRTASPSVSIEEDVGLERMPDLQDGPATVRVEATNDSPARFGRGRTTVSETTLAVMVKPPRVEVLSAQHYIRQAGSECVLYRTSDSAEVSGVQVGEYFFPGHDLPGSPGRRFALFAFPHDVPPETVPVVVARDAAGNEAMATFTYKLIRRTFRSARLDVPDSFLRRVVPSILAETPKLTSEGDLLEDFLQINGPLRRQNAEALVEMSRASRPEFLWKDAFTQLGGSQVMASFADRRTYTYGGKVIDHQVHLGFDLAVTANHPVDASNDGVVVHAGYFGIYGNTVVIDHGFGLQTLYSHLSSIDVQEGQTVRRGEVIGKSGATGLAGGDHLHFSVLLGGVPVDPTEWWDANWIQNRILSKIGGA
jgi:murein DD-endopeptidase MepM/ murein hydrolase activator NlpD